ncbi:MAG: stage III sporulation protein AF [Firmicutes bacterium]|nr:stage III sporulation protein AF [Bacillota bacterium]
MIEMICEYGRNAALFMIFIFLCEMIMPKNKYREIIRLVCAVFLTMIILKPLTQTDMGQMIKEIDIRTINAEYNHYTDKQKELTEKKFSNDIKNEMKKIIGKEIRYVKTEFNDDMSGIRKIDIEIENDGTITEEEEKNIKNKIYDFYRSDNVNIHIY